KQFFRFFSLGLFVASLIIFIFYNYFEEPEANPNDFSKEELVEIIEDDGYRVITEEDYISYTVNEDENNEDLNIDEKELEEEENQDNNVEYTLEINSGMMPHEVIALLEEEDIIEDADKFSEFMDKNDYSPYIQQGEFELTSDMSDEDIAKEITNK